MRRIVIDTNIYVDWLNSGRHELVLFQPDAVQYLSIVVKMELAAGAFSREDRRLVERITRPFARADRILLPSLQVYEEAGGVLRELQESRGYNLVGAHSLVNDVLIALSARSIGATVITQNERDFLAIRGIRAFKLVLI